MRPRPGYFCVFGDAVPLGGRRLFIEGAPRTNRLFPASRLIPGVPGRKIPCLAPEGCRGCTLAAGPKADSVWFYLARACYPTPDHWLLMAKTYGAELPCEYIPRGFTLKSRVLLVHPKAAIYYAGEVTSFLASGIFACFKPSQLLYWKGRRDSTFRLDRIRKRGIRIEK